MGHAQLTLAVPLHITAQTFRHASTACDCEAGIQSRCCSQELVTVHYPFESAAAALASRNMSAALLHFDPWVCRGEGRGEGRESRGYNGASGSGRSYAPRGAHSCMSQPSRLAVRGPKPAACFVLPSPSTRFCIPGAPYKDLGAALPLQCCVQDSGCDLPTPAYSLSANIHCRQARRLELLTHIMCSGARA